MVIAMDWAGDGASGQGMEISEYFVYFVIFIPQILERQIRSGRGRIIF